MPAHKHHSWLRPLTFALAVASGALVAPEAFAGEMKIGAEPLDTDDSGNITSAGKSAATNELESLPGEEIWPINVWAKLDKGAGDPLREPAGSITDAQLTEIAEIKMPDLNANDIEAAKLQVRGTARSMGIEVE